MLLSDFKSLGILSGIGMEQFIPYLQNSYEYVINKISLLPSLHKMVIERAFVLDQFNSVGKHYLTESEIAFKEIPIFLRTNQAVSSDEDYEVKDCIIGNVVTNNDIVPELLIEGSKITCTNMESCYLLALGYVYPYLVFTNNGYEVEKHTYDLEDMIDLYGFENLYIDNMLAILCGLKIKSLIAVDNQALAEASGYDYLLTQMLNKYNANKESIEYNTPTIDYGVLCH